MCTSSLLKPVMVEVGYTYRMKRQFEQLLEKRVDQVELAAKSTNKLKDPKVNKHIGRMLLRE